MIGSAKYTGITICVGGAPTRTLAKFAYRAAKKISAYRGVYVLQAGTAEPVHVMTPWFLLTSSD
ncbi:hypothetical protein [Vreelandella glaciei]|uniref:hypothetical protein n=1 Tax=Vreelandella glaciei TaxID=186761 RepID=UPI0030032B89